MSLRLACAVLAAGAGRRLGGPKGLALWQGRTFLDHVLSALDEVGLRRRVVVLGAEAPRTAEVVPPGTETVVNPRWDEDGMIGSLRKGLDHLEAAGPLDGLMVWPVDHPAVRPATLRALLHAFEASGAPVVVPIHGDRRGHPVIFGRSTFWELRSASADRGARAVVRAHPVLEVGTDDRGIRLDVDTPDALAVLRGEDA